MRYWQLLNEDEIKALSQFINKWSHDDLPLPAALARAVNRKNELATARFLAKAHNRWAQLLVAAGRTYGPIPKIAQPLRPPHKPTANAARYPSSTTSTKPAQRP